MILVFFYGFSVDIRFFKVLGTSKSDLLKGDHHLF